MAAGLEASWEQAASAAATDKAIRPDAKFFFIKISLMVETPPFGAVGFGFVWEGRSPFQISATHRAAPYVMCGPVC